MAFKIPKQPKSVMGFMTPLHRLSEAQKLAEIRARTNGDSHRASLEAAFDFFTDRDAAAAAEGPGNPNALHLMTQAQQDAEIVRRTKGPSLRDALEITWDFQIERDAQAAQAQGMAKTAPPPMLDFSAQAFPGSQDQPPLQRAPGSRFTPAEPVRPFTPIPGFGPIPLPDRPGDRRPPGPLGPAPIGTGHRADATPLGAVAGMQQAPSVPAAGFGGRAPNIQPATGLADLARLYGIADPQPPGQAPNPQLAQTVPLPPPRPFRAEEHKTGRTSRAIPTSRSEPSSDHSSAISRQTARSSTPKSFARRYSMRACPRTRSRPVMSAAGPAMASCELKK